MPEPAMPRGHVLGFDFGQRRIGVAVGQFATRTASALATVAHRDGPDWPALDRLVKDWRPTGFVVGLPLDESGGATPMADAARAFGTALQSRYGRPCEYIDERLTSHAAAAEFAARRAAGDARRKHAGRLDAVAARLILERWLQASAAAS